MISNGTTFTFTPFWLFAQSKEEQGIVQAWLKEAGVDIHRCPGFDYDGKLITTKYYARNEMGSYMIDEENNEPVFEHEVREFPAPNPPKSVKEFRHA